MKRVVPVLLACTFLLYLFGIQFIYWLKVENAKSISQSFILKKDLKTNTTKLFSFTPAEYNSLNWTEKDKEFVINNQDYDVIIIKHISGTTIEIQCYADNLETEISAAFQGMATVLFSANHQKGDTKENDLLSKITKEFIPLCFLYPPQPSYKMCPFILKKNILPSGTLTLPVWRPPSHC